MDKDEKFLFVEQLGKQMGKEAHCNELRDLKRLTDCIHGNDYANDFMKEVFDDDDRSDGHDDCDRHNDHGMDQDDGNDDEMSPPQDLQPITADGSGASRSIIRRREGLVGAFNISPVTGVNRRQFEGFPSKDDDLHRQQRRLWNSLQSSRQANYTEEEDNEIEKSERSMSDLMAFCLETGEHVEVNLMEQQQVVTVHAVQVREDEEDGMNDETDLLKCVIPSPPKFAIQRDGPRSKVLDSLTETNVDESHDTSASTTVTAITGMGGLGKSVVAAAAVSDPRVSSKFTDGVSWLSLGPTKLSPVSYRNCLLTLCSQIGVERDNVVRAMSMLSGFPFSVKETEQSMMEDFMKLKAILKPILGDKNCLIVLDDVWHREDIHLFAFGNKNHILITTRKPRISTDGSSTASISSSSLTFVNIKLGLPNEAESLQILSNVSGITPSEESEICSTADAKEILHLTRYLPLAIVSVGLLMRGCSNFQSLPASKILQSLKSLGGGDIDHVNIHSSCYHIFDQSFQALGNGNDDVGSALRLFFAAFCVCFINAKGSRVSIPQVVVKNFFEELLACQGSYITRLQQENLKKAEITAESIIQKLRSVGFFEVHDNGSISVHHDLQQEYGVKAAIIFEEVARKTSRIRIGRSNPASTLDRARARANAIVVKNFETRAMQRVSRFSRRCDWASVEGDDRHYMNEFLINHMIWANQHTKAIRLMKDLSFVTTRVKCFGVAKCRMWMLEEMKFSVQVMLEHQIRPSYWMKCQSVFDEAVVNNFINARSQQERDQIWRETNESRMRWILHGFWVLQHKIFTDSSMKYRYIRKVRGEQWRKMHKLLTDADLGDHPFALCWQAMSLLCSRECDASLEVRKRIMNLQDNMLPDNHINVVFNLGGIIYAHLVKGKYKEGIRNSFDFIHAVESFYGKQDSIELASVTAIAGECYYWDGQMDRCLEMFQEANAMCERIGDHGELLPHLQNRIRECHEFLPL